MTQKKSETERERETGKSEEVGWREAAGMAREKTRGGERRAGEAEMNLTHHDALNIPPNKRLFRP